MTVQKIGWRKLHPITAPDGLRSSGAVLYQPSQQTTMTTPRIFRPTYEPDITLTSEEARHFFTVLRKNSGDTIEVVFQAEGTLFTGILAEVDQPLGSLRQQSAAPSRAYRASVAIPLLKGGGSEDIIDAVTQLGVDAIFLFESDRSVVRLSDKLEAKRERFQLCATSAAAQAKRLSVPPVSVFKNLDLLLLATEQMTLICCALGPNTKKISAQPGISEYLIISGPEGDFSPREMSLLLGRKSEFVTLGDTVLRATLAPVVALARLQFALQ